MLPARAALGRPSKAWVLPEDAASLAVTRIGLGAVLAWHIARYLWARWPEHYYYSDAFLFSYFGFEWVARGPAWAMRGLFWGCLVAALGVCAGAAYRFCAAALLLGYGYLYLLSPSHYMNHHYLILLLMAWLVVVPAADALSVDVWLRRRRARREVPRVARGWLVFQLSLVYFMGGLAKLNRDWVLHQMPVAEWLRRKAADSTSPVLEALATDAGAKLVAWGGLAFDLAIAPALLCRTTRPFGVVASVAFHGLNEHLFEIGVFPWLMLALTPVFFEPGWPRRIPGLGNVIGRAVDRGAPASAWRPASRAWLRSGVLAWGLCQTLLPLRHWLYPGDVAWTEEGHQYSWRMKLRSKRGEVKFRIVTGDGRVEVINPRRELTARQYRKLSGQPELIRQYAWHLRERMARAGRPEAKVYADARCRLNYRPPQRLIDPTVDLSRQPPSWGHAAWITELEWTPPPRPWRP